MKKIVLIFAFISTASIFATTINDIDCDQLHIDVTNGMYNLGFTWAESEIIADAAYAACIRDQG